MNTYTVERTEAEINDVLDECTTLEETKRNPWPTMSYAQGVAAGIKWLVGDSRQNPIFS